MFSKYSIDINCDVAEGVGNEALLMPFLSSCNIACAAHAGDVETIDEVIRLAKLHQVKIGAHPSFPDRKNFGRKIMPISDEDLQKSIEHQIQLLIDRASAQRVNLHHIKLHGALYNLAAKDQKIAEIAISAIQNVIKDVVLFVPYNSQIAQVALSRGYNLMYEAFADRNYNDDLSLVARSLPNSVLSNKKDVLAHVLKIVKEKKVLTISGEEFNIQSDTLCVHGDHKNSVEILEYLYEGLKNNEVEIK